MNKTNLTLTNSHGRLARLTISLLSAFAAVSAFAQITVTNLGESSVNGGNAQSPTVFIAVSFTTDSFGYTLDTVTIDIESVLNASGNFQLSLYSDGGGNPGASLGIISGSANPIVGDNIYSGGSIALDAATTYWVVSSITSGTGSYVWQTTTSDAETNTPAVSWTIGNTLFTTNNSGSSWSAAAINTLRLSVSATVSAVPEPSTYAAFAGLAALGLVAWKRRRRSA